MNSRETRAVLQILLELTRRFPAWVLWRNGAGEWTATRAGQGGLVWLNASDPHELARQMTDYDRQ